MVRQSIIGPSSQSIRELRYRSRAAFACVARHGSHLTCGLSASATPQSRHSRLALCSARLSRARVRRSSRQASHRVFSGAASAQAQSTHMPYARRAATLRRSTAACLAFLSAVLTRSGISVNDRPRKPVDARVAPMPARAGCVLPAARLAIDELPVWQFRAARQAFAIGPAIRSQPSDARYATSQADRALVSSFLRCPMTASDTDVVPPQCHASAPFPLGMDIPLLGGE